jgi:micrococcal nuclease
MAEAELPIVDFLAEVASVADGDSFRAVANGEEIEVRLLGVNAPERDECFGAEATAWLRETLDGKQVGLAVQPEPDQFGRVLAIAVVDGTIVNETVVRSGHALVVTAAGADRAQLVAAEAEARSAAAGMWADDICGATGPRPQLEISDIDYDPPGPDESETVTIANIGSANLDVSGFVLRDESSANRFVLPAVVLKEGESLTVTVSDCGPVRSETDWCSQRPVFNNDGDTALLLDPFGRIVALARY